VRFPRKAKKTEAAMRAAPLQKRWIFWSRRGLTPWLSACLS